MGKMYENIRPRRRRVMDQPIPITVPLLNLPIELFLSIWDILPFYSRVGLSLTCRALYEMYGPSALAEIYQDTPSSRSQRVSLLRQLRKDSQEPTSFVCVNCTKLHSISYKPRNPGILGFKPEDVPCASPFLKIRQELHDRVTNPRDRGLSYYRGTKFGSTVPLGYDLLIDVGIQGLYTEARYWWCIPESQRPKKPEPVSSEDIIAFCRSINFEFCPHAWLGEDFIPGDGSLMDLFGDLISGNVRKDPLKLSATSHKSNTCPEYRCLICHVNIKLMAYSAHALNVTVVQYLEPENLPWRKWKRPARTDIAERPIHLSSYRNYLSQQNRSPSWSVKWIRRRLGRV